MRPKMPIIAQLFLIQWVFTVYGFINNYFIKETTKLYSLDFYLGLFATLFTLFLLIEFYYRRKTYTRKVIIWSLVLFLVILPVVGSVGAVSALLTRADHSNTLKLIAGTLMAFFAGLLIGSLASLWTTILDILFLIYFIKSKKVKEALNISK